MPTPCRTKEKQRTFKTQTSKASLAQFKEAAQKKTKLLQVKPLLRNQDGLVTSSV